MSPRARPGPTPAAQQDRFPAARVSSPFMLGTRWGRLAFGVCIGLLLTASLRSVAGDVAGCYELHLSEWSPNIELDGDKIYTIPPSRVALTKVPDHLWDAHGFRVKPALRASPSTHPFSYWTSHGRHVHIVWTNGHSGLTMDLEQRGSNLIGTAHTFWDFQRPEQTSQVAATKIPCEHSHAVEVKAWTFPSQGGLVTMRLTSTLSTIDGRDSYTLQIIWKDTTPNVTDEASYLRNVIEDMEKSGLSPRRIVAIDLEAREPDVSAHLARVAYMSPEWANSDPSNDALIVAKLLNSIDAYEPFNEIFRRYGLTGTVAGAWYISVAPSKQLGPGPRANRVDVPTGATIEFVLNPSQTK